MKIKSVKIWTRKEMTNEMFDFGHNCFNQFKRDVNSNTYGEDWKECAYSNNFYSAWVILTKNGMVSVSVVSNG